MRHLLYKKVTFLVILITTLFNQSIHSQDQDSKWVIGLGVNAIDFYPTNQSSEITGNNEGFFSGITNAKDHWNVFAPTVNVTRHIRNKFSADVSISINQIYKIGDSAVDNLFYFAVDGAVQYHILDSTKKLNPFVYAGGGYTFIDEKGSGTLNFGLGVNYWFAKRFGAKVQATYKYSDPKYEQVLAHFYYSLGIVFKLKSNSRRGLACL